MYGLPIGESNPNTLLDALVYEPGYLDGNTVELTANRIYGAILKSTDLDIKKFLMFKVILDHHNYAATTSKGYGWLKFKGRKS